MANQNAENDPEIDTEDPKDPESVENRMSNVAALCYHIHIYVDSASTSVTRQDERARSCRLAYMWYYVVGRVEVLVLSV